MSETTSLLLATTVLALGGLGLYLFKTNDCIQEESDCCTILFCPCKTPLLLLIVPCTFYNMCMNKYNNKYIC